MFGRPIVEGGSHIPELTLSALALVGITILVTSFIAGVFGVAGGMMLLGVLLLVFDVATAMVMFSILQFFSNASRVLLWRHYVRWPIFFAYLVGGVAAFAAMRAIAFVPNKAIVYLVLGLIPFTVEILPAAARPNIEWRGVPLFTGAVTTVVQLIAGSGGLFLDVFFQKSLLDRKTTIATKSMTQLLGHVFRVSYFASLGGTGTAMPPWALAVAVMLAIGATLLAPILIERMTDHGFRRWTRYLIFGVATVYLVRAGFLFWHG